MILVQLPEVPAPQHSRSPGDVMWPPCCQQIYTAAQLREYATEAVMAERRLIMTRVEAWRSEARNLEQSRHEGALDYHDALINCADDIEPLIITPSETNSER